MMNLFSSFDPTTNLFKSNWISSMMILLIMQSVFWMTPSQKNIIFKKMIMLIFNEMKPLINNNMKKMIIMLTALFMFIMMNNFMSLFPFIFSSSSHLLFSFSLSLPLWLASLMYGMTNNTNKIIIHLIPMKTPKVLISFMIYIELISNIIRPMTLAIRLSANIIAGHLILSMMSNYINKMSPTMQFMIMLTQLMIMILEMSMSVIQAYVFSMLITLYSKEMN